jgi:hypothetical protein
MLALFRRFDRWLKSFNVRALRRENEQLTMQLAACVAVAIGWGINEPLERGHPYWSGAYQDVLDLRLKYHQLFNEWKTFYTNIDDRLKLAYKDRATRAIEGMAPGPEDDYGPAAVKELVGRVRDLDKRYKALCEPVPAKDVNDQAARIILAFDLAREQVAELALGYTKSQSDLAAAEVAAQKYGEYLKLVGEPRQLQVFLSQNFPGAWSSLSDGRTLVEITTAIMGKLKDGAAVI